MLWLKMDNTSYTGAPNFYHLGASANNLDALNNTY